MLRPALAGLPPWRRFSTPAYYVANAGSDSNSGLSPLLPWQTVAKVNATSIPLGYSVLFNRGDVWREQLNLPVSGTATQQYVFGAYGSGAMPTFNGADVVTGWSSAGYAIDTVAQFVTAMGGNSVVLGLYDARYGVTQSGGAVSEWDDARGASGYGPSLTATGTGQPAWDATNLLLTFDGVNNIMASATSSLYDMSVAKTVVLVTQGAISGYKTLLALDNAAKTHYFGLSTRGGATYFSEAWNGSGANPLVNSGVASSASRRLVYAQIDGSTALCTVADSADVSAPSNLLTSENFLLSIGGGTLSTTNKGNPVIRAVVVVQGKLTGAQAALLRAWAYNQHGAVMTSGATPADPSNTYSVTVATAPKQLYVNDTFASKGAAILSLGVGQWYYTGTSLYYNDSHGNPDTAGDVVEASARDYGVYFNGGAPNYAGHYCTGQDLCATKANKWGIYVGGSDFTGTGSIVQRCLATKNYARGINSWISTNLASAPTQLLNNECSFNGLQGGPDGDPAPAGIEIAGSDVVGTIVTGNNVHGNYWGMEWDQGSSHVTGTLNWVHDNLYFGVNLDNSNYGTFAQNLVANNGVGQSGNWGVRVWSATSATITATVIVANTFYNNGTEIQIENEQTSLTIKNNATSCRAGGLALSMQSGKTYSGLAVDYNDYFGVASPCQYGATAYTLPNWIAALAAAGFTVDAHSISADPMFTSPGTGDFSLQATSPCKNAGVAIAGVTTKNPPDMGAYPNAP